MGVAIKNKKLPSQVNVIHFNGYIYNNLEHTDVLNLPWEYVLEEYQVILRSLPKCFAQLFQTLFFFI